MKRLKWHGILLKNRTHATILSKLQTLASKFENFQVHDNETIEGFNVKTCDIAN